MTNKGTTTASNWRNYDFLKLWSGETVSQFGAQITQLALPLIVLAMPGTSAAEVGFVMAVHTAPMLLVTPVAGVLIDTFDRRWILLLANLIRASALLLIPILALNDALTVPVLCAIAFAVGSGTAVFDVAYIAYLPDLVQKSQLVDANGKLQGTYTVAQAAGPGVGGFLINAIGAAASMLVNVGAFAFSFIMIALIRHRRGPASQRKASPPRLIEIFTSLKFLWNEKLLRALTAQSGWFNFWWYAIHTLFLTYAVQTLGFSAGTIGALLMVGGVTSLVGAIMAKRLGDRFPFFGLVVFGIGLASVAPIPLLFTNEYSNIASMALIATMFAIFGFGITVYNVYVVSYRQTVIPADAIGRASAAYRLITFGPVPLGALVGGILGTSIGEYQALMVSAIGTLVGFLGFIISCRLLVRSGLLIPRSLTSTKDGDDSDGTQTA